MLQEADYPSMGNDRHGEYKLRAAHLRFGLLGVLASKLAGPRLLLQRSHYLAAALTSKVLVGEGGLFGEPGGRGEGRR